MRKEQTESYRRTFPKREKKFIEEVMMYADSYPDGQMLEEFIDYWTEPNKSRTKMRFELEDTWDTPRRLKTWARKEKTFNQKQYGNNRKPFNKQQQLQEEADARRRDFIEAVHELNGGRPVAGLPDL